LAQRGAVRMSPGGEGIMEAFDSAKFGKETVPTDGDNAFGIDGR